MKISVVVHSKDEGEDGKPCPYCRAAKAFLTEKGIPYTEKAHTWASRQELYDKLGLKDGQRTVPQVIIVDEDGVEYRVGGVRELRMYGIESL
ncbi:MAG: glutaredoxin [Acetobacteraceae bacterium]|nr:glutaredoxin [Acetobacteraceae bacterium]